MGCDDDDTNVYDQIMVLTVIRVMMEVVVVIAMVMLVVTVMTSDV